MLAALLLAGLAGSCSVELGNSGTSRTTIRSGSEFSTRISFSSSSLNVESRGKVRFTEDETDVESLDPNGRFEMTEERDGVEREYRVMKDADGALLRSYWIDGKQQDALDETWIADSILILFRESAFGVEERVERLLARGGVELVLEETERSSSDFARSSYLRTLLGRHELSSADSLRALSAAQKIDSDFELAQTLQEAMERYPKDAAVRDAWLEAARDIESDYELARTLIGAAEHPEAEPSFFAKIAAAAASEVSSDYELGRVLAALAPHAGEAAVAEACFKLLESVDSDYERGRGLSALAPKIAHDSALQARYRTVSREMSDYERGRALTALDDAMRD